MSSNTSSLKILTIGNSFTDSLSRYFSQVVESTGCELLFDRANHGGCELHRHWRYIQLEEKEGACRMYKNNQFRMREILVAEPWDIVTIQQASHFSWRPETYQPYANNIHNYINAYAPQAEIVIQQTWAYRADDSRFTPNGKWQYGAEQIKNVKADGITLTAEEMDVNQNKMHECLTEAYLKLANELNLRIIPTGYAVQLTRKNAPYNFVNYDPELLNTLKWPDLPPQAGDVVGRISWRKDKATGELKLGRDTIHLNLRGEYMQACVWYACLYGAKTSDITYVPDEIADSDAKFLREMAQKAVDEFKR